MLPRRVRAFMILTKWEKIRNGRFVVEGALKLGLNEVRKRMKRAAWSPRGLDIGSGVCDLKVSDIFKRMQNFENVCEPKECSAMQQLKLF